MAKNKSTNQAATISRAASSNRKSSPSRWRLGSLSIAELQSVMRRTDGLSLLSFLIRRDRRPRYSHSRDAPPALRGAQGMDFIDLPVIDGPAATCGLPQKR